MLRVLFSSVIISCVILSSCSGKGGGEAYGSRPFPEVRVPSVVGDDDALDYIALHFWDGFSSAGDWLCDSLHIAGVDRVALERQVGAYASILGRLPYEKARRSILAFCGRMEEAALRDSCSNIFGETVGLMKRYLYDPNSPVRFEDAYGALAARLAVSPCVKDTEKDIFAGEAALCGRNMTGTPAADFAFTDSRGNLRTLYGTGADYTLLFFSNPGCGACAEITKALASHEKAVSLVGSGRLAVICLYIDEDIEAWRGHLGDWPREWICGYDHTLGIRDGQDYVIRAIPSVYALDRDKNVILKDAAADRVLAWIDSL